MAYTVDHVNGEESYCAVELDRSECLTLLRRSRIGRVVLSVNCIPVALPVNVSVLDDDVVFFTAAGSKLDAAIQGQVVSVEVDDIDSTYDTGWSVLVSGIARLVTDPGDLERARPRLRAWAPGPHPFMVRVPSTLISGRRLTWGGPLSTRASS
jgi:nitroimidazol reductase NimA-like FMN-containing flavoprotein (pyridoxamine 5'-phosphate oxidase superfamily)